MRFLKKLVKNGHSLYVPLPKDLAATYGWDSGLPVIIEETQDALLIRKAFPHEIEKHGGKISNKSTSSAISETPAASAAGTQYE